MCLGRMQHSFNSLESFLGYCNLPQTASVANTINSKTTRRMKRERRRKKNHGAIMIDVTSPGTPVAAWATNRNDLRLQIKNTTRRDNSHQCHWTASSSIVLHRIASHRRVNPDAHLTLHRLFRPVIRDWQCPAAIPEPPSSALQIACMKGEMEYRPLASRMKICATSSGRNPSGTPSPNRPSPMHATAFSPVFCFSALVPCQANSNVIETAASGPVPLPSRVPSFETEAPIVFPIKGP
ncbi:hypothetical protein V8C35DRAFT_261882 [Trichoderma chlorosporum]